MIKHLEFCRSRRVPLPMSSGVYILPSQSAMITTRPQTRKFYPERLLVKEAADWRIDAILVGNRALARDLPGAMFAPSAPGRFPGCGEVEVQPGEDLIVEIAYAGPLEAGIPFEACVFGTDDRATPSVSSISRRADEGEKIATARSGCRILPNTSAWLSTIPMKHDAWPSRLVIENPSDWVVHDVCVGAVSIFAQAGAVPGGMFAGGAEPAICLGHLAAGDTLSIVATYVGRAPDAELAYELYGTLEESEAVGLPIAVILPMSSGVNILPETSAQMTSRCRPPGVLHRGIGPRQGFLAERIVVERAADWVLNDVKVGNMSQFVQSGDVPGLAFGPGTLGNATSLDVARAGIDVVIMATYAGPLEAGSAFVCGMLGGIVDLADAEAESGPRRGRMLSVRDLR